MPRGLTRRAAVLAVLLLAAAVVLAPHLRMLAEQQATISALQTRVTEQEADVERLQGELARWEDPAFVQAQARERLFMVMPGETGYVVLDPPQAEEPAPQAAAAAEQAVEALGEDQPWFGTLWESVQLAGEQAPEPVPAPDGGASSGPTRSVPAPQP